MLKKLLFFLLCSASTPALQAHNAGMLASEDGMSFSPAMVTQDPLGTALAWVGLSKNIVLRNAVVGLVTYCIAYTLYQTAKGIGTTAWTWWKGEKLSPAMQRQMEIYVAELIQKNGTGQYVLRRAHHHEDGVCNCGECSEVRRDRA